MAGTTKMVRTSPKFPIRNHVSGDSLTDIRGAVGASVPLTPSWCSRLGPGKYATNTAVSARRLDHVSAQLFGGANGITADPDGQVNIIGKIGPKTERVFILAGINDISVGGVGTANYATTGTGIRKKFMDCASRAAALNVTLVIITLLPLPENDTTWWYMDACTSSLPAASAPNQPAFRPSVNSWITSTYPAISTFPNAAYSATSGVGTYSLDVESGMGGIDKSGSPYTNGTTYPAGPSNCRPAAYCGGDYVHQSNAGQDALAALVKPYMLPEL